MKVKIAAKLDKADRAYYEEQIKPLMEQGHVEFIGEISEAQKPAFLSGAKALLFPIDWPEPFGLVMIESMACGTPVIAFNCGSVPEVIDHGVSGFIVENEDEAVDAVKRLHELPRAAVRARFDERFTSQQMARNYISSYEELLRRQHRTILREVAAG
jgi:glycosyltransferase involved in cell wall biosynthesis